MEAIDLVYPTKLAVSEKRLPAFERIQVALVFDGQAHLVPRLLSLGLDSELEPSPAQPVYGGELFNLAMAQLIGGYGGHSLLVAAGSLPELEPMNALLDGLAAQAITLVQAKRGAPDGREQLLDQLRSELFLRVPTAGPLDLLRTEEAINRFWRELFNHREAISRLHSDLQSDLQQMLQRGQLPQWTWRVSIVNGRLRARQVATR